MPDKTKIMLSIYCQKCGSPSYYSLNKPRLCGQCGRAFDVNFSVANPSKIVPLIYSQELPGGLATSRPAPTNEPMLNFEGFAAELVEENIPKVTVADLIKQKPTGFSRCSEEISRIPGLRVRLEHQT